MSNSVQRFLSFAFASADVLIEVGESGLITFSMGACRALLGIEDSKLVGQPFLNLFEGSDRGAVGAVMRGLWPGARCGPITATLSYRRQGEKSRRAVLHACRLPDQKAAFSCTMSLATTAALQQAEGGKRDTETGLLDSESFAEMAGEAVRLARTMGEDVGMSFIDIPELVDLAKTDPSRGGSLIRRVGDLLRGASVGGNMAGRLAETRFGVVHKGNEADLERCLDDIRKEGRKAGADLTVGLTEIEVGSDRLTEEETVKAVRFAVNRFASLPKDETMPTSLGDMFENLVENTIARMTSFVRVVRNNQFDLTYQPVVDIASGKLHHYEVLTRFDSNTSPFETIQFAEEIDIIERFDLAVCARSVAVLNAGLASIPGLAVNLSGRSLSSPAFLQVLMDLAEANRHLAGRLSFEVTESAQLADLVRTDAILQGLRRLGFAIYLDDFGAGSASFQYLQALHVDGLKIDGEYVRRLGDSVRDHTILVGMVRLCKSLALESVAERVEDRDTAVALYEMGVNFGQGWFYGKPLSEPVWKPTQPMGVATGSAAQALEKPPAMIGKKRGQVTTWG